MATEKTLAAKITLDGSEADESIKSIKTQLKEANAELIKVSERFGDTSAEAVKAAKAVAGLKDRIGDAKALSDAFSPDKKFQAVSGAIAGVAGGFAAVQGGMALFGVESKETEKALLKVQAAMALSQGISSVTESIDAFKNLGTVLKSFSIVQKIITAGQWLWNAAMAANPIGAIIAVVAALIAGIVALTSWLIKSSDAAADNAKHIKDSTKALEDQKKATDKNSEALKKNNEYTLAMMKAQGASNDEIRKSETLLAAKETALARTSFAIAYNTFEIEKNRLATMKANDADEDQIKAQEELTKKYADNLNDKFKKLEDAKQAEVDIEKKHNIEIEQEKTNAAKKNEEDEKAAADKSKAASDKSKEDKKNALIEANKLLSDLDKKSLDERKQKEFEIEQTFQERKKLFLKAGITDFTAIEKDRQKTIDKLNKEDADKKLEEEKKAAESKLAIVEETEKIIEDERLKLMKDGFEKRQIELDNEYKLEQKAALKILDDKSISEEDRQILYNARKLALEQKYIQEKQALKTQNDADEINAEIAKLNEVINSDSAKIQAKEDALNKEKAILDKMDKNSKDYTDRYKKYSESRVKVDTLEKEQKVKNAQAVSGILSGISELVGKQTAAGKVAAIAAATIDTFLAAQKAFRNAQENPISIIGPAYPFIQAALAVAVGLKNVKAIISTPVPGGGGGGSIPSSTISGLEGTAPLSPQASVTALPQDQINQLSTANAAVRNYVLETDVTSNQERITRINRAARIN